MKIVLRSPPGRIRLELFELIELHLLLHFSIRPVSFGTRMYALSGKLISYCQVMTLLTKRKENLLRSVSI